MRNWNILKFQIERLVDPKKYKSYMILKKLTKRAEPDNEYSNSVVHFWIVLYKMKDVS